MNIWFFKKKKLYLTEDMLSGMDTDFIIKTTIVDVMDSSISKSIWMFYEVKVSFRINSPVSLSLQRLFGFIRDEMWNCWVKW
jgi:hypothetical protein